MAAAPLPSALPLFLKAAPGERFCLYHQPDPDRSVRGQILYVHPFAEELNKCRRMAALQARALARAGFGVLQIDLYGCGDSSGDFADARWSLWRQDLALAWRWLAERGASQPRYLWGLRLGALLALEFCGDADAAPAGMLLWQPVISGAAHLHQFQRLHSAARLFSAAPAEAPAAHGQPGIEIAGYTLAPQLSDAIKLADAGGRAPRCPVHWFELASGMGPGTASDTGPAMQTAPVAPAGVASAADATRELAAPPALQPASALLTARWREAGANVVTHALRGAPFWATPEISVCPTLLDATLAAAVAMAP